MWVEAEHYRVVGAILEVARRRAGLTQQELAKQLGKPQSFVSEYERGKRRIDVVELVAITTAFGISPEDLFSQIVNAIAF